MKSLHLFLFTSLSLFVMPEPGDAVEEKPMPILPQPATSFGAAIADGWVYVYGGNTGKAHEFHKESVKGDFFRLNIQGGSEWEKLPGGQALLSPSLVAYEGKIIRIGGLNARNEKGTKADLYSTDEVMSYDPATQKWTALPVLPETRSSHDSVVVGSKLYVGGGWQLSGDDGEGDKAKWYKTMLVLDLKALGKGWQSMDQPFERRALAVVADEKRIWFLGGMDSLDEPSRDVDWYELASGTWGKDPQLPDGSMAGFGIAGGVSKGRVLASPLSGKISALSADYSKWEEIGALKHARFFHRLLPLGDGTMLAVGGSSRKGQIKELEIFNPDAKPAAKTATGGGGATKEADVKQPTESPKTAAWPQWRGQKRDGVSDETGWRKDWPAEGPKQLWKKNVGVGVGSCVAAGGRLIVHSNDGNESDVVTALDAATGAELWKFTFPCKTSPHEMPMVPQGPGATPTVAGGHVYALSREGDILCLDVTNGQPAWRKNLVADLGGKRPVYGYTQSPLVDGGRIFLDVGSAADQEGSTVSLDAATGEIQWRAGKGEAGYSSARMLERDGKRYLAMFKGEAFDVLDPADGKAIWSQKTTARDYCNALTPVFVGHKMLVSNTGTDPARLLDWDMGATPNVREVWTQKQFALLFNNPILLDGHLFAFNEKRKGHVEFTCLNAETGESKWVADTVPVGTFILSDSHWIFLTRDGEVVLAPATADGLKPIARFKALEGKCYPTPTLADGRLYVRSNAGDIAAYDLSAPTTARKSSSDAR